MFTGKGPGTGQSVSNVPRYISCPEIDASSVLLFGTIITGSLRALNEIKRTVIGDGEEGNAGTRKQITKFPDLRRTRSAVSETMERVWCTATRKITKTLADPQRLRATGPSVSGLGGVASLSVLYHRPALLIHGKNKEILRDARRVHHVLNLGRSFEEYPADIGWVNCSVNSVLLYSSHISGSLCGVHFSRLISRGKRLRFFPQRQIKRLVLFICFTESFNYD